jgi:hypothetical protein
MRLEYKFLVNNADLNKLRNRLLPFVELDPFVKEGSSNEYVVRSIYYDTSNFDYYYEKIDGYKIRKKLRVRSYDKASNNSLVFLEIKHKYDNFIGKNRSPFLHQNLEELFKTKSIETYGLTNNGYERSIQDGERFFHFVFRNGLKPTILIVYDREAYFSKFDSGLRITFDKNIRFFDNPEVDNLFRDDDLRFAIPNYFVLELKFKNGYPRWLQNIVREFNLTRSSVSKYTICIDVSKKINPEKKNLNSSKYSILYDQNTEEGIF